MDNLIVDLDKVLDDFEAEESTPQIPGQEIKPTDYANFVAEHEDKPWDDMSRGPISSAPSWNLYQNVDYVKSVSYDVPYTPVDNFDLSEADFAPKVDQKQTYTGPLDSVKNIESKKEILYIEDEHENLKGKVLNGNIGTIHSENSLDYDADFSYLRKSKSELIENVDNNLSNSYFNNVQNKDDSAIDIHLEDVKDSPNYIKNNMDKNTNYEFINGKESENHVHNMSEDNEQAECKYPVQVVDKFTPVSPEKAFPHNIDQLKGDNSIKGVNSVYDRGDNLQSVYATSMNNDFNNHLISGNESGLGNTSIMENQDGFASEVSDKVPNDSVQTSQSDNRGYEIPKEGEISYLNTQSVSEISQHLTDNTFESLNENKTQTSSEEPPHKSDISENTNTVVGFGQCDSDTDSGLSEQEVESYLKDLKPKTCTDTSVTVNKEDGHIGEINSDTFPTMLAERKQNERFDNDEGSDDKMIASEEEIKPPDETHTYSDKRSLQNDLYIPNGTDNTQNRPDIEQMNSEVCNKTDLVSGVNIPDVIRSSNENSPQRQNIDNPSEIDRSLVKEGSPQMGCSPVSNSGGARPKEPVLRPSSLVGLSKVSLDKPFDGSRSAASRHMQLSPTRPQTLNISGSFVEPRSVDIPDNQDHFLNPEMKISQPNPGIHMENETDIRLRMENSELSAKSSNSFSTGISPENTTQGAMPNIVDSDVEEPPVMRRVPQEGKQLFPGQAASQGADSSRPHSWGPSGSASSAVQQQKRPNSLNLPSRGGFGGAERSHLPYTFPYDAVDDAGSTDNSETPESGIPEVVVEGEKGISEKDELIVDEVSGAAAGSTPSPEASLPESPMIPSQSESVLGKVAPRWIPDAEAPTCMGCDLKFTFTKRRHHCRACGKVFCSQCCNMKNRLLYMDNKEARVCQSCHQQLAIAEISSRAGRSPNPNNPSEYCTTIPPSQQANARSPPPTVMVPVVGVLKREGSHKKGEPKQVMFSDGIRPGGDLTELDGSDQVNRIVPRRSGRSQKKVERTPTPAEVTHQPITRRIRSSISRKSKSLIPDSGLPPLIVSAEGTEDYNLEENPDPDKFMPQVKDEAAEPVIFAINANLFVMVKILNLDCCVNRICWCFTSKGMCTVGQDEIIVVLEIFPDENTVPRDIFCHFQSLYEEAGKGNTVTNMGHSIFNHNFLDSRDHGGMLYICPTFQCLHKLMIPSPPYVFGILLQKWEVPWAKVFPIRLLLRLGAEYRYYPCPLISVRNRKPVFFEIGHTIMNLLADFRNYQYMLPQIKGITIHMEDKKTLINFPRNRYDELMKVVSNSNEHVMAIGASFSSDADSHLVCIQNDEGNYQTQAINIQNKPRKVTGASFVVFNGALKTSSGLKAKSSIVEDGLMVQISPDSMAALKQAMKDMLDYTIGCGSVNVPTPDEEVVVQWIDDDKHINIGVKSPIDDIAMDGIESIHIPNATDYMGENRIIRWTDVFFIQNEDTGSAREPVDLSRLAETLSNASCIALAPHLDKLKEASLTKIGLRVTIEAEKVGYEIGANGDKLPDFYMNDLDNELIPVIHSAASQNHGGATCLELIFHVLD